MTRWPARMAMRGAALALVIATACTTACTAEGPDDGGPTGPAPVLPLLLLGGDISALTRLEQAGATYRTTAGVSNAITALRLNGANLFRLRLFLAPNGDEVQVNDLPYTIALAKRVRASGAQLLLDFHYSDTWADPAHQVTPAAWTGLGIDSLEAQVERYTKQVIDTLRVEGVVPRIVQVGNEIDAGLLWPVGRIGGAGDSDSASYADFGRLVRAGVRGVRAATTAADSVRVMIHYSGGANIGGTQWFYDLVQAQNVPFDIIGLSYYPWWHGTIQQLRDNLTATANRYGKDIMVVETSYPWRDDWVPSGSLPAPWAWPRTADGQATFLRDVIAAVDATPDGHGIGVVWWYPEAIVVPGVFMWGGGSLALFDPNGMILPAAGRFQIRNARPD